MLLREIREQGYEGGYSILTSFLLTLKSKANEAVVHFETEPGEQMQVDFIVMRRGRDPLWHSLRRWAGAVRPTSLSPVAKTPQLGVPVSKRAFFWRYAAKATLRHAKTII